MELGMDYLLILTIIINWWLRGGGPQMGLMYIHLIRFEISCSKKKNLYKSFRLVYDGNKIRITKFDNFVYKI